MSCAVLRLPLIMESLPCRHPRLVLAAHTHCMWRHPGFLVVRLTPGRRFDLQDGLHTWTLRISLHRHRRY
jgi:hypothetical protein